jgi:hypothetical protein
MATRALPGICLHRAFSCVGASPFGPARNVPVRTLALRADPRVLVLQARHPHVVAAFALEAMQKHSAHTSDYITLG